MEGPEAGGHSGPLDTSVPHIARVYDYWLGGKDNFPADRKVAEQVIATRGYNEQARDPVTARTHTEVRGFFQGLDLVDPGVVQLHRWRPGARGLAAERELANYGGVGRKP
jgi:hypothetical protein